ncbi:nickel-sensing transcriptional repressor NcrB [Brevundimonas kwangchunensis]|uniref:Nickel-sensing transcriptional repressor NcrB n=1 Tax=Brevundimonas kwangchunensis TaxID=322163 RepID=A0ABN1H004_9CAUL
MAHVSHASHPDIIKRLRRADGHLHTVIQMMQSGRPCLDLAQQLHAIEKAVAAAKKVLIHDHIDHCLAHAAEGDPTEARQAMAEFKEITKYL